MRLEHWMYTIPLRLRSLFRRHRVERELDEELQYHLQGKAEEFLAQGMAAEDARRARRAFPRYSTPGCSLRPPRAPQIPWFYWRRGPHPRPRHRRKRRDFRFSGLHILARPAFP